MKELFVIGDIHGKWDMLNSLLTKWNPTSQQLVFLGDYIDRGPDSLKVIRTVKELKDNYGAIALGGNHELNFLDWLEDPEDYWYYKWYEDESAINEHPEISFSNSVEFYSDRHGGRATINSFRGGFAAFKHLPSEHAKFIKENFAEELKFLRELPNYFEWGKYLCVHAGINPAYRDWKKTEPDTFRIIREAFHFLPNETDKIVVFGHTKTRSLNKDGSNNIWLSKCKTKIGIDGGACEKGVLHGLVINDGGLSVHSVHQDLTLSSTTVIV